MADLYNTILAQNTLGVAPTSNLGTRNIVFMCLSADANFWNGGNYNDPGSDYAVAIRTIQRVAELYYVGPPDSSNTSSFVFAVSSNTTDTIYNEGDWTDYEPTEDSEANTLGWVLDELYGGAFTLYRLLDDGPIID